jgi:hypothetical protein
MIWSVLPGYSAIKNYANPSSKYHYIYDAMMVVSNVLMHDGFFVMYQTLLDASGYLSCRPWFQSDIFPTLLTTVWVATWYGINFCVGLPSGRGVVE